MCPSAVLVGSWDGPGPAPCEGGHLILEKWSGKTIHPCHPVSLKVWNYPCCFWYADQNLPGPLISSPLNLSESYVLTMTKTTSSWVVRNRSTWYMGSISLSLSISPIAKQTQENNPKFSKSIPGEVNSLNQWVSSFSMVQHAHELIFTYSLSVVCLFECELINPICTIAVTASSTSTSKKAATRSS